MEYYVLLLLVGLFHTVTVSGESPTEGEECKDQLSDQLEKMNSTE